MITLKQRINRIKKDIIISLMLIKPIREKVWRDVNKDFVINRKKYFEEKIF